jgi:hypothetical protein
MIEFFIGFVMGYLVGANNKRDARVLSAGMSPKDLKKYDNLVLEGIWQGQKQYLRIMINSIDAGLTVEELRETFVQQLDYCDQELAVHQTKELIG